MRLLFIKFKHIGDVLLLTPTLDAIKERYPDAEIDVVVRRGTEGILAGCPSIRRIILAVPPEKENRNNSFRSALQTIREMRKERYDYVVVASPEDRAVYHALLARCGARVINPHLPQPAARLFRRAFRYRPEFPFRREHAVVRDFELVRDLLDLGEEPPAMRFETDAAPTDLVKPGERFAIVHPVTRWDWKEWPAGNWQQLLERMSAQFDRVLVSVGPAPAEIAVGQKLADAAPENVVSTAGRLKWPALAATLKRAEVFVGVDTAAMHLAAACQCPIVALFGKTQEAVWGPWKCPHVVLAETPSAVVNELADDEHFAAIDKRRMEAITVDQVEAAVLELAGIEQG